MHLSISFQFTSWVFLAFGSFLPSDFVKSVLLLLLFNSSFDEEKGTAFMFWLHGRSLVQTKIFSWTGKLNGSESLTTTREWNCCRQFLYVYKRWNTNTYLFWFNIHKKYYLLLLLLSSNLYYTKTSFLYSLKHPSYKQPRN